MQISLRHSLFRILLGGIVITVSLILVSVWNGTTSLVQNSLDKEITVSKGVFRNVIEERAKILGTVVNLSSTHFDTISQMLRDQSQESVATTKSFLESMQGRTRADWVAYVTVTGKVVASVPDYMEYGSDFPQRGRALLSPFEDYTSGFMIVDGTLFHVVVAPVKMPRAVGYSVSGFAINNRFLKALSGITQGEIIVHTTKDITDKPLALATSLSPSNAQRILEEGRSQLSWLDFLAGNQRSFVSRRLNLEDMAMDGLPVELTLAIDVSEQYDGFAKLLLTIVTISLLAILVSMLFVMFLSRRVSRPVSRLMKAVNRIADGEYDQTLPNDSRLTEIANLSRAFTTMQHSLKNREERIRFQAQHDMLTGLYNRNYMEQLVADRLAGGVPFQVLGITIPGFRAINDLYGYANGDKVLQVVSERLCRWQGVAARLSGGEVLFIAEAPLTTLQLETLQHILEQPVEVELVAIPVKVAFATIDCPADANSAEELFRKINIVTDEQTQSGHWLMRYDQELENRYLRRLSIITELKHCLQSEQSELSMVYQPKVALRERQVCSMEALIRWNSKVLGFVPPDEFIGIAEQAGLVEQVTSWVMNQTIRDIVSFRAQGYDFTVAMNLSTQDIQNAELLNRMHELLNVAGLQPGDLELEITESDLVSDASVAIENIRQLNSAGFRFAIDDFGTGYSSLAYLKDLPVHTIKIDKSFVLKLATDKNDQQIVKTVLSLAHIFGLSVVAEGVEDDTTLALLADWGCDIAQGYYISKPVAAPVLLEWLDSTPYNTQPQQGTS
ncbi:EAL domain-containing protein [Alteromonas sp. ASW11-19]|uniref:EAL domain-containing protein n=1 Tax=Alteromonas salexigens TaxID=2982530 RepID=A0ABT2VN54_9ALTE|nr:GGDEF domain-containing phosphodiesterase [Alteromonas salexigens]MCU7554318.1 EAL domain-containing protein [Alteromonas salexigens]